MLKGKLPIDHPQKPKVVSEQNHYDKVKLIGQGTFGKVYLVHNRKDGQQYALKEVLQDKRYKNRELSIISRVKQSNIICMRDYFIKMHNDQCYLSLVMDYLPCSLNAMIKEQRKLKQPFDPYARKVIMFQIFKALYYFNINSLCHRDLKPPNILINDVTLQVRICDFGSAKILETKQDNVSYICSRYYRAPELLLSSTIYGTEIDVWSVGCIMVELLTCQAIFPGDSSLQQLIEIIKILGTPPEKYLRMHEEAHGNEIILPTIKTTDWGRVLRKYKPEPQLVDLISLILIYDTEKRLNPFEILSHKYFNDLTQCQKTVDLPQVFNFRELYNGTNEAEILHLQQIYAQASLKLKEVKKHKVEQDKACSTQNTVNS